VLLAHLSPHKAVGLLYGMEGFNNLVDPDRLVFVINVKYSDVGPSRLRQVVVSSPPLLNSLPCTLRRDYDTEVPALDILGKGAHEVPALLSIDYGDDIPTKEVNRPVLFLG